MAGGRAPRAQRLDPGDQPVDDRPGHGLLWYGGFSQGAGHRLGHRQRSAGPHRPVTRPRTDSRTPSLVVSTAPFEGQRRARNVRDVLRRAAKPQHSRAAPDRGRGTHRRHCDRGGTVTGGSQERIPRNPDLGTSTSNDPRRDPYSSVEPSPGRHRRLCQSTLARVHGPLDGGRARHHPNHCSSRRCPKRVSQVVRDSSRSETGRVRGTTASP